MIRSIKIAGFKNFFEKQIELTNLKKINILVGVNGSGKSSVLELIAAMSRMTEVRNAISGTGSDFGELYSLFQPKTEATFYFDDEEEGHYIEVTPKAGNVWEVKQTGIPASAHRVLAMWNSNYSPFENSGQEQGSDPFIGIRRFNDKDVLRCHRMAANVFLEKINKGQRSLRTEVLRGQEFLKETSRPEVGDRFLAGGTQYLSRLIAASDRMAIEKLKILLIDDMGDALYPAIRKDIIPFILELFTPQLDEGTQCFATTHNIEVVKSALDHPEDCNVYMFDYDGSLLEFTPTETNKTLVSPGILPGESVRLVAKMLGIDDTDLGYPELVILVEEETKKTFIEALKGNGLIANDLKTIDVLVPFQSGDGNTNSAINGLLDLSKYFFFSEVWSNRYVIFVDHNSDYCEEGVVTVAGHRTAGLKKAQDMLGNNFLLTKREDTFVDSLEGTYPEELWLQYKEEKKITEGTPKDWLNQVPKGQQGKSKSELAAFIGGKISKKQFLETYKDLAKIII